MEKKIRAYYIASANNTTDLMLQVNSLLKEGWEPFGSVFVVAECVHQPMITYKSK